jgi:N-acetylglucosamine malate deacetylase 2
LPLLDIVRLVEQAKAEIRPDIIFTHFPGDLNVDHRITFEAVLTATRPLTEETVKEIYSFEVLSSTEWRFPSRFQPDLFFDITNTFPAKIEALKQYRDELNGFPHPRSTEGMEWNARTWGMKSGCTMAEAFKVVRILK